MSGKVLNRPSSKFAANAEVVRIATLLVCATLLIIGEQGYAQDTTQLGAYQERCDQAAATPEYTILDQACDAMPELGVFEEFSCLDGEIIPITVDDQELSPQDYRPNQDCDRPPWLQLGSDGQCNPFARVGRLDAIKIDGSPNPDVDWAFICRRYTTRSDALFSRFEDVAIIGTNRITGATTFYQTLSSAKPEIGTDGIVATRVPPPHELLNETPQNSIPAEKFWLTPQQTANIGCHNCHDSDPWIHTPYIDQVCAKNASSGDCILDSSSKPIPLVPAGPDLNTVSADSLNYYFVGRPLVEDWNRVPRGYFLPAGNKCVSCHVLGNKASSLAFARNSTGTFGFLAAYVTDSHTQYPHSHWMAPDQAEEMSLRRWNRIYERHVQQILQCNSAGGNARYDPNCNFVRYEQPRR